LELKVKEELIRMFEDHFHGEMNSFEVFAPFGHTRILPDKKRKSTRLLALNQDFQENTAFLKFSEHSSPVNCRSQIYAVNAAKTCYLQRTCEAHAL